MAGKSVVLGAVAAALLLAGCGAGASSPSAADATSAAAAPAVPVAAASWQDPASQLDGQTPLGHIGRRTGSAEIRLAQRGGGTVSVSTECQGAGQLHVALGATVFDLACTDAPSGSYNESSTGGPSPKTLRVTADPGVTWSVAVGWTSKPAPKDQ